jgi:hypothetical protein
MMADGEELHSVGSHDEAWMPASATPSSRLRLEQGHQPLDDLLTCLVAFDALARTPGHWVITAKLMLAQTT